MRTRGQCKLAEASLAGLKNSFQQNAENTDQSGKFSLGQPQSPHNKKLEKPGRTRNFAKETPNLTKSRTRFTAGKVIKRAGRKPCRTSGKSLKTQAKIMSITKPQRILPMSTSSKSDTNNNARVASTAVIEFDSNDGHNTFYDSSSSVSSQAEEGTEIDMQNEYSVQSQTKVTYSTLQRPAPVFQSPVDPIRSLSMTRNFNEDLEVDMQNPKLLNRVRITDSPCPQNAHHILLPPNLVPFTASKFNFNYGLNAFKLWMNLSYSALGYCAKRSSSNSYDPLQMTAEEICYLLCRFIEEVRLPDGSQFSAVALYYFVLGVQRFLNLSSRLDNIFVDACYKSFAKRFHTKISNFLMTFPNKHFVPLLVTEEHLWQTEQLGALSPRVLLNTILFLNMKLFGIKTVEEHKQLSLIKVLKCWEWIAVNSCCIFLRFTVGGAEPKFYYHRENNENPLRCPVRLYEYYVSKCPNTRIGDLFYLKPEISCVPNSQIWYTSKPLSDQSLQNVLNLYRMVNIQDL